MRHFLANVATYTIAIGLVAGAALFAWMRSAQLVISSETAILARYEPVPPDADLTELGQIAYKRNCMACHLGEGQGWDQYPGLGHTVDLFQAAGGREYIIDLHLYGLTSPRWRAPMPPMGHMSDVELAAVLNHVLRNYGNEAQLTPETQYYTPDDIASRRGMDRSPREVNATRPAP